MGSRAMGSTHVRNRQRRQSEEQDEQSQQAAKDIFASMQGIGQPHHSGMMTLRGADPQAVGGQVLVKAVVALLPMPRMPLAPIHAAVLVTENSVKANGSVMA